MWAGKYRSGHKNPELTITLTRNKIDILNIVLITVKITCDLSHGDNADNLGNNF